MGVPENSQAVGNFYPAGGKRKLRHRIWHVADWRLSKSKISLCFL
jgi:hypothetical protein